MGEIAVAIADDNERILDLLSEMIENNKEMKLVGKANNGEDVYTLKFYYYHCSGTGADYRRCISQRCFLLYSETVQ